MNGTERLIDADGSWECSHVDDAGRPAPPARLAVAAAADWPSGSVPQKFLRCPDCGAHWRIWPHLGVARPTLELRPGERPQFRHAPRRDVDRVVEVVRERLPDVGVTQNEGTWPADDNGLWAFRLPARAGDVQLESATGDAPFLVEHSRTAAGGAESAATAEDAARVVLAFLSATD